MVPSYKEAMLSVRTVVLSGKTAGASQCAASVKRQEQTSAVK
jgi:hypothetical protein